MSFSLPSFLGGLAFAASFHIMKLLHRKATEQSTKLLSRNAEHDQEIQVYKLLVFDEFHWCYYIG